MKARKIALWGVLSALAIVFSALESLFELPFLPPGAKPGLSNIVTVSSAMLFGAGGALYITVIKALFALFTRGTTAFFLSLAGGVLSSLVTVLLLKIKTPFSLYGISLLGAVTHNLGQTAAAVLLIGTGVLWAYFPILLVFALVSGTVTGVALQALAPYIENVKEKLT